MEPEQKAADGLQRVPGLPFHLPDIPVMPGIVASIAVSPGIVVEEGMPLLVLEAMKMLNELEISVAWRGQVSRCRAGRYC